MPSQIAKPWLQPFKFIRNGKYPSAEMQNEMAGLANHIALYRLKEIASFGNSTTVIASPAAASERPRWRTRYNPSSTNVKAIVVKAWMAQSTLEDASTAPYVVIDLDNGTDSGQCSMSYGAAAAENANPDHMAVLWGFVMVDPTTFLEPDPTTTYAVKVSDYQSRIAACTIYELSLNAPAPYSEGFATTTPILDIHQSQVIVGARTAWKGQAAPEFTWTVDDQASPRTRTSATEINLIDNSSTGVSAATVGFTIDLRNRARVSTGTVPVAFRVYGKTAAGSAGKCKLYNSSAVAVASITNISTSEGWYEVTAELPATRAKYDIHYAGDGTNQVSIGAVNLVQFSA